MAPLLAPALTHVLFPLLLRLLALDPGTDVFARADAGLATPSDPHAERAAFFVGADGEIVTPGRLRRFLEQRGSPLGEHAEALVAAGLRHGVDPRWVVAIAGTETNFGQKHKGFNAWGWDAPNGLRRWSSWEDAIDGYTRHFARGYRVRDPHRIGARYAPFAPHWPATTRLFFSQTRAIEARRGGAGPDDDGPRPDAHGSPAGDEGPRRDDDASRPDDNGLPADDNGPPADDNGSRTPLTP